MPPVDAERRVMRPASAARTPALAAAYAECARMARAHYENFPVASLALPRRLREPVGVIYAFARSADDIADEGHAPAGQRLERLDAMARALDRIEQQRGPEAPLYVALADVVVGHALPLEPLRALLHAFRMDVTANRYEHFGALMEYCRHSANPVGRLLLHLFGATTPRNVGYSDAVCSALQLINFLQDWRDDYYVRGRIYVPQDEMRAHGVTDAHFADCRSDSAMRALQAAQCNRARRLLQAGAPLGRVLRGRAGLELRMIVQGGLRMLARIERRPNVFERPTLTGLDRLMLLWRALARRAP